MTKTWDLTLALVFDLSHESNLGIKSEKGLQVFLRKEGKLGKE